MILEGDLIRLRAVEPEDVEVLHVWENDPAVWLVSGTTEPFSREQILRFVERQLKGEDLFRTGQLRLMIECREVRHDQDNGRSSRRTVGTMDLFEYDPLHGRAGIGILIHGEENRRRGYARDAVEVLCRYARERLRMHQLWCNVGADNRASLGLFRKAGFQKAGIKRDWLWTPDGYRDEILLQKILD